MLGNGENGHQKIVYSPPGFVCENVTVFYYYVFKCQVEEQETRRQNLYTNNISKLAIAPFGPVGQYGLPHSWKHQQTCPIS